MTNEDRITLLKTWDRFYHDDKAMVDDATYDEFRDETKRLIPDHPYFATVGAKVTSKWEKAKHPFFMGSLEKCQTPDEMRAWMLRAGLREVFVSHKWDGIAIRLRYEKGKFVQAVTRGDGEVGEDITVNVRKMRGVPVVCGEFTGNIRGEIVLRKSVFAEHFKDKKNPRNAAGGAAKDLEGSKCHLLDVVCYQHHGDAGSLLTRSAEFYWLSSYGFQTFCDPWVFKNVDEVLTLYQEFIDGRRAALDFDIDGLVVEVNDTDAREAMGESGHRSEGARAFKFPHMKAETTLRDVLWQVGASGRVTPVAVFDPVDLAGATVRQATLHNLAYIRGLSVNETVRVGDTVLVSRRNDCIPAVESVTATAGGDLLSPPNACPSCTSPLKMDGEYLICPNKLECEAQTTGSIKRWIKKVGVKDFGPALIEALCEAGTVSEPADLYKISDGFLAETQLKGRRLGDSSATIAIKNLREKMNLPLHVIVGSLGIPLWSRSMVKVLVTAGYDTIEKMACARIDDLVRISGVETTKAGAFVEGFFAVRPKIESLLAAGITIAPEATGSLKGKTVCLTGFRDATMDTAIEAAGGTMKSGVVKGLTYLVAKDTSGTSGKLAKARENGTKVVSAEEMWKIIRQ
jgi:DNA ligase (NAD+)